MNLINTPHSYSRVVRVKTFAKSHTVWQFRLRATHVFKKSGDAICQTSFRTYVFFVGMGPLQVHKCLQNTYVCQLFMRVVF